MPSDPGQRPLNQAETDVARGAWRRVCRPGVRYVDAGCLPDGRVELLSTDPEALDRVATALCAQGTQLQRTQLPQPTRQELAKIFNRPQLAAPPAIGALPPATPATSAGPGLVVGLLGGGLAVWLGLKLARRR